MLLVRNRHPVSDTRDVHFMVTVFGAVAGIIWRVAVWAPHESSCCKWTHGILQLTSTLDHTNGMNSLNHILTWELKATITTVSVQP